MSRIDVVIPTYRRAELLRTRSIPTILGQTLTDWRLHVVGDGTDDDTEAVVASFADPRIRFTNIERQTYPADAHQAWGVSAVNALNHGWDTADAEWLWILGDDDELAPHAFATLLGAAERTGKDVVYGIAEWWNQHGSMGVLQGAWPPGRGAIADGAVIRRTSLPYRYGADSYERAGMEADSDIWTRMVAGGVRFLFVPKVVHRYWHWRPGYGG